ncbi:MAG: type I-C CRISPR-associated protein Cas8c/Csd1 [Gemmiger sp.]|nr:type I-C CRISPR-associated protein Cas8c/Csd1 [Gemmiger sp.]
MILQALTHYYETMLAQGKISPLGWDDAFKVSFGLELGADGTLLQLIPYKVAQQRGKKLVVLPQSMRVPAHVKRSSGVAANFLCDTVSYMLGADAKGKPARALECFAANKALHQQLLAGISTEAAQAILAFFETWNPAQAPSHPLLADAWKELNAGANLVFCYRMQPVTTDPEIAAAWQQYYNAGNAEATVGQCLVTGKDAPIATLHPSIKGVRGAQTMGAALVSFNAPAFESYGHTQGQNAPVSEYAAFAYTTALNALLADTAHCRCIGDTTVVCWAEHGGTVYQDFGMESLFGPPSGVDERELRGALENLARGQHCEWKDTPLEPGEHFYFLGLAPNAARLSVRFFLQDRMGSFMARLQQHYRDIDIVRPANDPFPTLPLWKLLEGTVNLNARTKAASPKLAGEVLRSILSGTPYPATLLQGAELRIRATRDVTRAQAAIIKGYYTRYGHFPKEVLQMGSDKEIQNIPYVLGQLFSVYEQIQQKAIPSINATIKDKYFNAASATPSRIFPVLGKLAVNHLRVLGRTNTGAAVNFSKKLGKFSEIIGTAYPDRLNLPAQGSFQLGYYFENQNRYTKKETVKEVADHV